MLRDYKAPSGRAFVREVWAAQPHEEGWVFLSFKSEGQWKDIPVKLRDKKPVRLPQLPLDQDVYFCATVFRKPERKREFALPSLWLHADLDEVDPDGVELAPTTAWETSKGRYQCLWRLTRPVKTKQFEALNQRLTYLSGADKGGWSVTKVLRVPGTLNHKRGEPEPVELLWENLQHYLPRIVLEKVRDVKVVRQVSPSDLEIPDVPWETLYQRHRRILPGRARTLLRARKARVGQRSERMWELECLLAEAGVPQEEILVLVRGTVWNKYAGQRREIVQLWTEVNKAAKHHRHHRQTRDEREDKAHVLGSPSNNGHGSNHRGLESPDGNGSLEVEGLSLISYDKFLSKPLAPELWTVEGVWSHEAHGLIAGEAKTFKSFVATDLAVSVASGTKFLGEFAVPAVGPVMMIQEENTKAMMQDRLHKIVASRKLMGGARWAGDGNLEISRPEQLPIHLMNNAHFNLTNPEHMIWLEKQLRNVRPKLLVLDPLYLMIPGMDENRASEIAPILRHLLMLKQEYGVGILIVHHYNKPRDEETRGSGNRISGTSVFYRWFESAMYLEKGKRVGEAVMTTEHRGHAPTGAVHLFFDLGEMGTTDYHVEVEIQKSESFSIPKLILEELPQGKKFIRVTELADKVQAHPKVIKRHLDRMPEVTLQKMTMRGQAGGQAWYVSRRT